MTHDTRPGASDPAFTLAFDPWAALQDGRRQLRAALDACDPRFAARTLTIPEFAAIGASTGSLASMLLAHAARDRAHAVFFAALDTGDGTRPPREPAAVGEADWSTVRAEVDAARQEMLEVVAGLASERWEQLLLPDWDEAGPDYLPALLLVRAMCDGMLAEAIARLAEAAG